MRAPTALLAALTLASGACGGGPPAPAGLAYRVPTPASATYLSADTARMDIDADGQGMQARVNSTMTLEAAFAQDAEGVRVTMTLRDMEGRMSNPAGAPVSADERSVEGPLVFTLDRKGAATLVSEPKVSQAGQTFFQPLVLAHAFFPRLPGTGVATGERWVDTIRVEGAQGEGRVSAVTSLTYTAVGDTLVGGRSLLRITLEGETDQEAQGLVAGMDFAQSVSGSVSGWVLWDTQRGMMSETYTESDLRGTMDVVVAPFPLGLRLRQVSHARLQGET